MHRTVTGKESTERKEVIQQMKKIIGRFVPQNFDQCLDDLQCLKIDTRENIICLVDELYKKAVENEDSSAITAKLCAHIHSKEFYSSQRELLTFESVLLKKCLTTLKTPLEKEIGSVRQHSFWKTFNGESRVRSLAENSVDKQMTKSKYHYYGNIRFISELYLKDVITTRVICFCIEDLLTKEKGSYSLVLVCKILEKCGSKLEMIDKGKRMLNHSLKKLCQFSESLMIEPEIRLGILDLIEMRRKKWRLRKIQLSKVNK